MKEASIDAKQAGERGISAKSVKKVTEVTVISRTDLMTIGLNPVQQTLLKFKG